MESIYTASTKVVNGMNFYFVKKYTVFSEYNGAPKILDSLGMHTNFYSACNIAKVYDELIINKLMNEVHIIPETAKVVHMKAVRAMTHSLIKNTHQVILKLRLAGLN